MLKKPESDVKSFRVFFLFIAFLKVRKVNIFFLLFMHGLIKIYRIFVETAWVYQSTDLDRLSFFLTIRLLLLEC
jgi:hypothetical protein